MDRTVDPQVLAIALGEHEAGLLPTPDELAELIARVEVGAIHAGFVVSEDLLGNCLVSTRRCCGCRRHRCVRPGRRDAFLSHSNDQRYEHRHPLQHDGCRGSHQDGQPGRHRRGGGPSNSCRDPAADGDPVAVPKALSFALNPISTDPRLLTIARLLRCGGAVLRACYRSESMKAPTGLSPARRPSAPGLAAAGSAASHPACGR